MVGTWLASRCECLDAGQSSTSTGVHNHGHIDSTPLEVLGCTQISLQRIDEQVRLPKCCDDCLVIERLAQVNADIVLGVDTISSLWRC